MAKGDVEKVGIHLQKLSPFIEQCWDLNDWK